MRFLPRIDGRGRPRLGRRLALDGTLRQFLLWLGRRLGKLRLTILLDRVLDRIAGPGRRRFSIDVEQLFARVEDLGATPAAHPAFGDAQLILHHPEDGAASGTTGGETHGAIMP